MLGTGDSNAVSALKFAHSQTQEQASKQVDTLGCGSADLGPGGGSDKTSSEAPLWELGETATVRGRAEHSEGLLATKAFSLTKLSSGSS